MPTQLHQALIGHAHSPATSHRPTGRTDWLQTQQTRSLSSRTPAITRLQLSAINVWTVKWYLQRQHCSRHLAALNRNYSWNVCSTTVVYLNTECAKNLGLLKSVTTLPIFKSRNSLITDIKQSFLIIESLLFVLLKKFKTNANKQSRPNVGEIA